VDLNFFNVDNNPAQKVKIGSNLLDTMEEGLIKCLREKADLFACSSKEMPGTDVTSSMLTPLLSTLAKRSAVNLQKKKAQTTKEIISGLIQIGFISEINYTEWLSRKNLIVFKEL
jgi:hypothetical protein